MCLKIKAAINPVAFFKLSIESGLKRSHLILATVINLVFLDRTQYFLFTPAILVLPWSISKVQVCIILPTTALNLNEHQNFQ